MKRDFPVSFSSFLLAVHLGNQKKVLSCWLSLLALAAVLILHPLPVTFAASDGSVDLTFNPTSGASSNVLNAALQSDGKVLIAGDFINYNNTLVTEIARLHTDGRLDTSFNLDAGGKGANSTVRGLAIQNDGKIIIGGNFTMYNGVARLRIARLNSDGSLDTSFDVGSGVSATVYEIAIQNDGKVLIGGDFTTYNGVARKNLARLNSDGSLDTSFDAGSGASNAVRSIALQSDGKILIGGDFATYNGISRPGIARINANGSLDTSFNPGSGTNGGVNSLALQSDGKIIIGGQFTTYNGANRNTIVRINSNGSLDTSFNPGSGPAITNATAYLLDVTIQSDGKVLICGNFTGYSGVAANQVARLNTNGSLDITFSSGSGAGNAAIVNKVVPQSDGKLVIGGYFTLFNGAWRGRAARLNSDGSLDNSFNGLGADSIVNSVAFQSDGKILIGGQFTDYKGAGRNHVARVNSDGTLDTSFVVDNGANGDVTSIVIQSDGKILIGGSFSSYNMFGRKGIARLNTDGSLDTDFHTGIGANGVVNSLAIQSDGKILIGGAFTTYNSTERNRIARLNSDGSLDTSFNPGTGANGVVNSLALQSDGRLIIGGDFTGYNDLERNRIARLNTDGSLDATFAVGTGTDNSVNSLSIQSNGKIIIGGAFTTYNSTGLNRLARLNSDGSLDTSFNIGTGIDGVVNTIVWQNDGKILIGGAFTGYNGIGRNSITRLNSNGSLDTTFIIGAGANNSVNSLAIQSNGKVLIGGAFTVVGTYYRNYIARLENTIKPQASVELTSNANPSQYEQLITFTATTTPQSASGTVMFTFGSGGSSVSVTTTLVNGVASYMTSTLPVGNTPVQASYSGDTTFAPGTSPVYAQTVTKATSSLSVTSSANPVLVGAGLTFTATLEPLAASGLVTFTFNGLTATTSPVVNGVATYLTNTLPVGTYTVTATYSGDSSYTPSVSPIYTQVVVIDCNPLVVMSNQDNGQGSVCGTFSYALLTTSSGATITFALTSDNTIIFTGSLTPTLAFGVGIDGGEAGVILEGNGVAGNGLRLGGGNQLTNLTIRNFGGQELLATVGSAANYFFKVRVQS